MAGWSVGGESTAWRWDDNDWYGGEWIGQPGVKSCHFSCGSIMPSFVRHVTHATIIRIFVSVRGLRALRRVRTQVGFHSPEILNANFRRDSDSDVATCHLSHNRILRVTGGQSLITFLFVVSSPHVSTFTASHRQCERLSCCLLCFPHTSFFQCWPPLSHFSADCGPLCLTPLSLSALCLSAMSYSAAPAGFAAVRRPGSSSSPSSSRGGWLSLLYQRYFGTAEARSTHMALITHTLLFTATCVLIARRGEAIIQQHTPILTQQQTQQAASMPLQAPGTPGAPY